MIRFSTWILSGFHADCAFLAMVLIGAELARGFAYILHRSYGIVSESMWIVTSIQNITNRVNSWINPLETSVGKCCFLECWRNIVDKQNAFNLMSVFYRVIYQVVLMIEIKRLMEKFNQDLVLFCFVWLQPLLLSTSN